MTSRLSWPRALKNEVALLTGGEAAKPGSRIFYPVNPSRRQDMPAQSWWADVPRRELGPHHGRPDALRGTGAA